MTLPASLLSSLLLCLLRPRSAGGRPAPQDDAVSLLQAARQAGGTDDPLQIYREQDLGAMTVSADKSADNASSNASEAFLGNGTGSPTVCVWPQDLSKALDLTVSMALEGLPAWPKEDPTPAAVPYAQLAFLIQVSQKERLSMVPRVFNHLYDPFDAYLYLVDERTLQPEDVRAVLPDPLPLNVNVLRGPHAGYYYWPRVQVLLNGIKSLLSAPWDFVIHLSESDYPLHSLDWIRATLGARRRHIFLKIHPRCKLESGKLVKSDWYWWGQESAVASCEGAFPPRSVPGVRFPTEELEEQGFVFASAAEWMILSRELVQYAMQPELDAFKRLVGMHAAADEIFWATMVLNIPRFPRTINPQSWFMFRSPANNGHSPDTLIQRHLELILAGRRMNFFLRKVDAGHSSALLDMLDEVIARPDDRPGAGQASWDSRQHAASCAWRESVSSRPSPYWRPPPEPKITAPFAPSAPSPESWLPA